MKTTTTLVICIMLTLTLSIPEGFCGDVSALQFYYLVKQVFPETQKVTVLITKSDLEKQLKKIERASIQCKVKTEIFDVENSIEIGKAFKRIKPNEILIIFDNELFLNKKNKMYIMSKSKEKQILIVTSSKDYVNSGALLGYITEDGKKKIVVNLKLSTNLKDKFTDELIQKVGIKKVIM